jgi:hypothetical protein
MRTHIVILATIIALIFSAPNTSTNTSNTANSATAVPCSLGAFTFGGVNYKNTGFTCLGSVSGNEGTSSYEDTLRKTTTWADGLAWTYNAKQDKALNNSPSVSGTNSIGLIWNKLDNYNYIVQFESGMPANANSVVIVLKAGNFYSTYRMDCIDKSNPSGIFNVVGVTDKNNELSHMSVFLAQNPLCEEVVQSNSCIPTITSLNNQIDDLRRRNVELQELNDSLQDELDLCEDDLEEKTAIADNLDATHTELEGQKEEVDGQLTDMTNDFNECDGIRDNLRSEIADLTSEINCKEDNIQDLHEKFNTFVTRNEECESESESD